MANVQELKAQAYDLIANIEFFQLKLREVNAQIAEQSKQENGQPGNSDSSN